MKKRISILLILALVLGAFAGCTDDGRLSNTKPANNSTAGSEANTENENNNGGNGNLDAAEADFSQDD